MSDIFDKERAQGLMRSIFGLIQESGCTHAEAYNAILWVEAAYTGFMGEKYVELARKWRDEGLRERLDALREPIPVDAVGHEADGPDDDGADEAEGEEGYHGSDHADLLST